MTLRDLRFLAQDPFPERIHPENPRHSRRNFLRCQVAPYHLADLLEYLAHQKRGLARIYSLYSWHAVLPWFIRPGLFFDAILAKSGMGDILRCGNSSPATLSPS